MWCPGYYAMIRATSAQNSTMVVVLCAVRSDQVATPAVIKRTCHTLHDDNAADVVRVSVLRAPVISTSRTLAAGRIQSVQPPGTINQG